MDQDTESLVLYLYQSCLNAWGQNWPFSFDNVIVWEGVLLCEQEIFLSIDGEGDLLDKKV